MKAQAFKYKGYTFKPIGNILGGFFVKGKYTTISYVLEINGYTHADFYKVARKHHASCDIFLCEETNKCYIPVETRLVGILEDTPIKKCEDYERWYQ